MITPFNARVLLPLIVATALCAVAGNRIDAGLYQQRTVWLPMYKTRNSARTPCDLLRYTNNLFWFRALETSGGIATNAYNWSQLDENTRAWLCVWHWNTLSNHAQAAQMMKREDVSSQRVKHLMWEAKQAQEMLQQSLRQRR